MQEGRRQEAEGRREESLYSKLFNLFQLDTYFRHAVLVLDQPKIDGLGRTRGRGDGETRRIFTRQSDCGGLLVVYVISSDWLDNSKIT